MVVILEADAAATRFKPELGVCSAKALRWQRAQYDGGVVPTKYKRERNTQ